MSIATDKPAFKASMRFQVRTLDQLKPLLQGYRRVTGVTQAEMAEKLGITQQSYAQIEADPSRTSVERLFVILRLLNVEIILDAKDPATVPELARNKKAPKAPLPVKPPTGKATSW